MPARRMLRLALAGDGDPVAIDWAAGRRAIARMGYDEVYAPETFDAEEPGADLTAFMREVRRVTATDWAWLRDAVERDVLPADVRLVRSENGFRIEVAKPAAAAGTWSLDRLEGIPDRAYLAAGLHPERD